MRVVFLWFVARVWVAAVTTEDFRPDIIDAQYRSHHTLRDYITDPHRVSEGEREVKAVPRKTGHPYSGFCRFHSVFSLKSRKSPWFLTENRGKTVGFPGH